VENKNMADIVGIISGIGGAILKPITDFFNKRQEIKAQEHKNQVDLLQAQGERQSELARQGLAADAAWEMTFAQQAASSWKDEFELLLLSAPLALCFVKLSWLDGPALVIQGFQALEQTPSWFKFLVVTIYLANYGIRYWRKTQSDT
jgi:hypothetical protein